MQRMGEKEEEETVGGGWGLWGGAKKKKLQALSIYNADAVCVTEEAFKEGVCVCVSMPPCV